MNIFVGSYTDPTATIPDAKGKGILRIKVDPENRQWQVLGNPIPLVNPIYLAWIPERKQLLSVAGGGGKPQRLVCLQIPYNDGNAIELGSSQAHGEATCHIAVSPERNGAFTVSYMDACLDAHQIEGDGSLTHAAFFPYTGKSIHFRQQEAHAHQACLAPDRRHLYVCDLGSDCIWKHPLKKNSPFITAATEKIPLPEGEGPRHMLFDATASRAYVIAELTGRLLVLDWLPQSNGTLRFVEAIEGLPEDYTANRSGAAIVRHPCGKTILTSQRQHNSIAFFQLNNEEPHHLPQHKLNLPCGGQEPRDMMIDRSGRWLFVANQDSDTITIFELGTTTGLPFSDQFSTIEAGTPVCLLEETPT